MKTTLDIPDSLFRRARARAVERGIPLRQFVAEAVEEKLIVKGPGSKPWMKMAGGLQHLHRETTRINRLIEQEFERID
jgi:hypothetical protein